MSDNLPQITYEKLDTIEPGYLGTTPPVSEPPPCTKRLWIDNPALLQQAVYQLARARVVALDAEFTQNRSSNAGPCIPHLALLQLAIDQYCFVVDTLRIRDLSPLKTVVENTDIALLLHGAGSDIRVMSERKLRVVHYYDLEAISRSIFGQHESSLASMLRRAFNIHLDKSLQRTDWTRRPLSPAMVAYAARDAEVTLALYHWFNQHYSSIVNRHKNKEQYEPIAGWIKPFLQGAAPLSPEAAVAEALARGTIHNKAQISHDCRVALTTLTHPLKINRLLRLIADLSLTSLIPDIIALLHAATADERAGSARALARLGAVGAWDKILPLLQDPVFDVRKAAQTALFNLAQKQARQSAPMAKKLTEPAV